MGNFQVENTGAYDASEILLAFPPTEAEHIAMLKAGAAAEGKRKKKTHVPLEVIPTELANTPNGAKLFSIALLKPLKSGEKAALEVIYTVTHSLEPFPAEISANQNPSMFTTVTVRCCSHHIMLRSKLRISKCQTGRWNLIRESILLTMLAQS